jgi:hypothetical protein
VLVEVLGQYQLELSAMQLIQNGGWVAYAAIRKVAESSRTRLNILPYQRIADDAVFESEAAAIAGARRAAMALLASANPGS